jgi:pyruvate dehydrogenase E1 component alpha subunit
MIEAFTYRMDAHTTSDDPTRYRLADEEEHWKLLDPIERVRVHLAREGLADQAFFDEVNVEADELAARFRTFCVGMTKPAPERMFAHVYSEPHAGLQAQQREHAEYLAGFADGGEL